MTRSELFQRAEDCEHQTRIVTDPVRRRAYSLLRDMWITLANGSVSMSEDVVAHESATIAEIEATAGGMKDLDRHQEGAS